MNAKLYAALITVQLAFATLPVAGKIVLEELSPYGFAWFRLTGAALVFLSVAAWKQQLRVPRLDVVRIGAIGLLGTAFNQLLYLGGLEQTDATHAAVLVTTIPVFAFLFAVATRREKVSLLGTAGVLIAFAGVLYLAGIEEFRISSDTAFGDMLLVTNCASYALYLVLIKGYMETYGVLAVLAISFCAASLFSAPFGLVDAMAIRSMTQKPALTLVYVLLVPTLLTYFLNAFALSKVKASTVAIFIYLQPIVGVLLAVLVLHEVLGTRTVLSGTAVLLGITLVSRARAANARTRSERQG